jgi:DNA invertase Pin-like site-specific DNA recombinase
LSVIGYARVSSIGQSLDVQLDQLKAAGCEKIFSEKMSGRSAADRPQFALAMDYVREGDVLVVTRMDRLSRSLTDLRLTIDQLSAKGVGFKALQQAGLDTTRPEGKLMLAMLGAFAEFENDIRKERQSEGICKAKAAGVYKGRKATIPTNDVKRLRAEGVRPTDIARQLKIGRASVYRALLAQS